MGIIKDPGTVPIEGTIRRIIKRMLYYWGFEKPKSMNRKFSPMRNLQRRPPPVVDITSIPIIYPLGGSPDSTDFFVQGS
jgi:hypothetical protein